MNADEAQGLIGSQQDADIENAASHEKFLALDAVDEPGSGVAAVNGEFGKQGEVAKRAGGLPAVKPIT